MARMLQPRAQPKASYFLIARIATPITKRGSNPRRFRTSNETSMLSRRQNELTDQLNYHTIIKNLVARTRVRKSLSQRGLETDLPVYHRQGRRPEYTFKS